MLPATYLSMRARMFVTLRRGVLDPAGEAVKSSLNQLGFEAVQGVRLGKVIDIELDDMPEDKARKQLTAMGKKLLANTVIEDFTIELT